MKYYVNDNAQTNGDHEVHKETCGYQRSHMKYLGDYSNCADAVKEAKKTYSQSNGCKTCSLECHTS